MAYAEVNDTSVVSRVCIVTGAPVQRLCDTPNGNKAGRTPLAKGRSQTRKTTTRFPNIQVVISRPSNYQAQFPAPLPLGATAGLLCSAIVSPLVPHLTRPPAPSAS